MRSEMSVKDIEMQELKVRLEETKGVLQSTLDDEQQVVNELVKKLRDDSAQSMRAVNTKQGEIDVLHKKLQGKVVTKFNLNNLWPHGCKEKQVLVLIALIFDLTI